MTDLSESLFTAAARALESIRAACARHLDLLEAQRAALRAEDGGLLAALAEEASACLGSLERGARLPPELGQLLPGASGPRASELRRQLAAARLEAEAAEAAIRAFTGPLALRRRAILGALTELSGGGCPRRPPRPAPAELDATG